MPQCDEISDCLFSVHGNSRFDAQRAELAANGASVLTDGQARRARQRLDSMAARYAAHDDQNARNTLRNQQCAQDRFEFAPLDRGDKRLCGRQREYKRGNDPGDHGRDNTEKEAKPIAMN